MLKKLSGFADKYFVQIVLCLMVLVIASVVGVYLNDKATACNRLAVGDVYVQYENGNPFYINQEYEILEIRGDFLKFRKNSTEYGTCTCFDMEQYFTKKGK